MLLLAASGNEGKLREFAAAASDIQDFTVRRLPGLSKIPAPEETGRTFEENATLKALYYSRFSDGIVFADDSGLEVDALGSAPGVYSARYAGPIATDEENNRLLLRQLAGIADRRARYVCVIALARGGELLHTARGEVHGEVSHGPKGQGGFGYDPYFLYPPLGRTFAELELEEKFKVSHRGIAFRKAGHWLQTGEVSP